MKQSQLFTKSRREAPKDEESLNAQLLIRAGFIDKLMAGVYTFLPLGLKVFKKIENIIREEMVGLGAQEILMPTLQSKSAWETTGRWDSLDSLIKFTTFYTKNEYALGPTHEEVVSPLLKKFILSYKDLPTATFQIQNKFRDEKRARSGLIRGREFFMKDLYSFHADETDADKYYEEASRVYEKIFKRVGLGDLTYLTYASGGSFSKYSHEFQTLAETGEDTVYVCAKCKVAVNKEIIEDQNVCPKCESKNLEEKRAIEVGNIFKLKTKYSNPFNLVYKDENGNDHDVIMGCYGIGINRLMGTIAEIFNDEKGIIWPKSVAPFQVHLLNLKPENHDVTTFADKIYNDLQQQNIEVLYDDRKGVSVGEKFADSDLIGIPYRAVISEKNGDKIEIKKREEKEIKLVSEKELLNLLHNTN